MKTLINLIVQLRIFFLSNEKSKKADYPKLTLPCMKNHHY